MRMFNRFDQKGRIRPVLAAITMGVAAVALLVPALPSHAANGIGGNFEIDTNANLVVDGTAPAVDSQCAPASIQSRSAVTSDGERGVLPGGICSSPSRLTAL